MTAWRIIDGDAVTRLRELDAGSVQTCVTSPPYFGLRDYGNDGQIGLEPTPDEYVAALIGVFREVRRVLRDDGTLWLNLGDSYAGSGKGAWATTDVQKEVYVPKPGGAEASMPKVWDGIKAKDLLGIPWMVAFALRADGWYLRSDIIWSKPNPMPESVTDRPTKAHEYLFLLSKGPRYFYDATAIAEANECDRLRGPALHGDLVSTNGNSGLARRDSDGTRNKRSVWTVATQPFPGAHFAVFPPKLIEPCVLAGSAERACGVCGAPWRRVVEKGELRPVRGNPIGGAPGDGHKLDGSAGFIYNAEKTMVRTDEGWSFLKRDSTTVGFEPSCDHQDGTGSSVVLDPFAGAGTTGLVATRHGRGFIGIELNPEYAEMARQRIRDDQPLMNYLSEAA